MIDAFADWLDNDPNFIAYVFGLCALGWLVQWAYKRFRSRGEEAGVPEKRNDETESPAVAATVTVHLVQPAVEALEFASLIQGDTRTDAINRALQFYASIVRAHAAGGEEVSFISHDGSKIVVTVR